MDQFYFESGYLTPDSGYYVYTADVESAQAGSSTLTATVGVIKSASSALAVTFTQTAIISHIEGADLFAMSNAAMAVEVSRIRDNNILASAAFSIATDASRTRNISSDEASAFTIDVTNLRVRYDEAALDAAFSLACNNERVRNVVVKFETIYSTYSQNVSGTDEIYGFFFRPDMDSYRQIQPGWYVDGHVDWIVTAVDHTVDSGQSSLITITGGVFGSGVTYRFVGPLGTYATLQSTPSGTIPAEASLTSQFTQTASADKFIGIISNQTSAVELTATVERFRDVTSSPSSAVSLAVDLIKTAQASSTMSATASMTAMISHIEGADLFAMSNTSLSVSAVKITDAVSNIDSTASQTVIPTYNKLVSASLSATTNVSVTAERTRGIIAGLSSQVTLTAQLTNFIPTYSWSEVTSGTANTLTYSFSTQYRQQPTTSGYRLLLQNGTGSDRFSLYPGDAISRSLLNPGTNLSCIEFWYIGANAQSATNQILYAGGVEIQYNATTGYRLMLSASQTPITYDQNSAGAGTAPSNTQAIHIAVTRSSATQYNLYVNGTRLFTQTVSSSFVPYIDVSPDPVILFLNYTGKVYGVDEFRYSIGASRYSGASYTVPTTAFSRDGYTRALSHFDQSLSIIPSAVVGTAALTSQFTQTTVARKFGTIEGSAALTSAFAQSTQVNRRVDAVVSLSAFVTQLTVSGRIQSDVADLDLAFALSVSGQKIRMTNVDLTSQFSMTATGLDLDLANAALVAQSNMSVVGSKFQGVSASLTTNSNLVCVTPIEFAQFYANVPNSGYITSSGATIAPAYYNGASGYGFEPVIANLWFKLERNLAQGEYVELYSDINSSNANIRIEVFRTSSFQEYGLEYPVGTLLFNITVIYRYVAGTTGAWKEWSSGNQASYDLGSTDITQWTNFQGNFLPSILQTYNGTSAGHATATWANAYVNGQLNRTGFTSNGTRAEIQTVDGWSAPYLYGTGTLADGGQWGNPNNIMDLFLDNIWIKKTASVDVNQFYNNGYEQFITTNGTTLNGTVADVWLPFTDLLDHASTTPTWDYTKNNRVVYGYIFYAEADLASNFAQSINYLRIYDGHADLTTTSTVSAISLRVRPGNSAVNVQATLTAQGLKAAILSSSMSIQVTANILAVKTATASSQQQVTAALTATNIRVRYNQASLTSQASLTVNAVKIAQASSTQTVTASQITTVLRIRKSAVALQAFDTVVAAVAKIGVGLLAMDSNFTQITIAEKTVNPILNLSTQASILISGDKVRNVQASLTSQASITVLADKIKPVGADLVATAVLTSSVVKITRIQLAVQTTSQVTAEIKRTRATTVGLSTSANLTAIGKRNRLASATLTARATVIVSTRNIIRAQANLQAFNTVLAVGQRIRFDPYYRLAIKSETRALVIHKETALLTVDSETRVNIIKGRE
ncbi:hypothetical protein UFOVP641_11 [uncultured Caudovirales phage]|uniref:Concanavalin A-like lectin/glucanases superfamily n=1 Tax=uncultured Caudovirales phage TaxID=2100421 RepID=A0A6J5N1W2_9CAUD|nr:hypothetical protein UFOVP641_11 [uncultured Caudovirales phage]